MKRFFSFILILVTLSMACNTILQRPNDESPTTVPSTPPENSFDVISDIVPKLDELGGVPCEENEDLTCDDDSSSVKSI
ncbi:MAG: hypothetical protein HC797_07195 [Anaerolineales bacterium]|nr:hypothetical protein [Anaerolineales bacterium]